MVDFNLVPLLPEIFVAICAMGLLIVGVNGGNRAAGVICHAAIASLVLAFVISLVIGPQNVFAMDSLLKFDRFTQFMKLVIMGGLVVVLLLAAGSLQEEGIERFEFPVLVLLAGVGMMMMISAHNFLSFYMGLELQSLSLYVLAAMRRNSRFSAEAGVKYFTLGALSSGMILFGISLIYGFSGSVDFAVIGSTLASWDAVPLGIIFGMVFLLAGIAFKISAVPFHMWTPDVYQGAPTIVTAFFAIVPKVAAISILVRVLLEPFGAVSEQWMQIIYALSLASMMVGAFAGLAQENIKRLLAYSSIGNMGYVLIGMVIMTPDSMAAVGLYLMIYMVGTGGTFAVLLSMRRGGIALVNISDLGGLSKNRPALAYGLAILMFSMSGIPPMAGFFGKLFIFQAAIANEMYVLAVLGVVTSVVAAYYYLRVVKVMFFDDAVDDLDYGIPLARQVVIFVSVGFVVLFVTRPSVFIAISEYAVQSLSYG